MAASPQVLDVNTGQPTGTSAYRQSQPAAISEISTSGGRTDVANTNQQAQTRGSSVSSTSAINTTPQALDALHSLIASLTEKPAISQDELDQKAPLATPVYSPAGWRWYDPLTGKYMNQGQANLLNTQRQVEQKKMQQAAGTIPNSAGTSEQQRQQGERTTEIGRSREQQGAYSKQAATADAQHLVDKAIADALRAAEPGITLASEGAGTSKSTYRAGALQEAATRGGIEGAALGANLGVAYGQIYNQLEGILEQLTRIDPNGPTAMLLQALQTSKGMVQQSTTGTDTSGTQNTQGQQTTQKGPETTLSEKQLTYNDAPALGTMPLGGANLPAAAARPTNPVYGYADSSGQGAGTGTITSNVGGTENVGTFDANAAYQEIALANEDY